MYMKFTFHVQTFVGFGGESFHSVLEMITLLSFSLIVLSFFLYFSLSYFQGNFVKLEKVSL